MIRYCISPVIGTGDLETNDEFRASVSDVPNVNISQVIPSHLSGPNIGEPKFLFAFCVVATPSVAAIAATTNCFVFPDYNLDGRMDGMETNARTAFQQSVEAYNLDGNGFNFDASNVDGESWRTVINRIVQQIEPSFNIQNVNVAEVSL
jgi:hypothetical protein